MGKQAQSEVRVSIRAQMGRFPPGTCKLNRAIVIELRGWMDDGMSIADAHAKLRSLGYKVGIETVRSIKGGRAWQSALR